MNHFLSSIFSGHRTFSAAIFHRIFLYGICYLPFFIRHFSSDFFICFFLISFFHLVAWLQLLLYNILNPTTSFYRLILAFLNLTSTVEVAAEWHFGGCWLDQMADKSQPGRGCSEQDPDLGVRILGHYQTRCSRGSSINSFVIN